MTNANSITIDLAWYNILSEFSETLRRRVFDAIFTFAATGKRPSFKGQAKLAFEFIAHEISKQITIPEPTEHTDSSEKAKNSGISEPSPVDEEPIIQTYYERYSGPRPFVIANAVTHHALNRQRTLALVSMSVHEMVVKGDISPDDPQFYTTLNEIVHRRFDILRDLLTKLDQYKILQERDWIELYNKVQNIDPL